MSSKRRAEGAAAAPAASSAAAAAAAADDDDGSQDGKRANLLQLDKLSLPSGLIVPDFDLAALTVEELRKEMEVRGLDASGSKAALCERLQELIAKGDTPAHRLTEPVFRKKKPLTRKEPKVDDYATMEEYEEAWVRWRKARDDNNLSVKRSRENQRRKKQSHEDVCDDRARENEHMEAKLLDMRQRMAFLLRAISNPVSLTQQEQRILQEMLLEEARKQESAAISATLAANAAAAAAAMAASSNLATATLGRNAALTTAASMYSMMGAPGHNNTGGYNGRGGPGGGGAAPM